MSNHKLIIHSLLERLRLAGFNVSIDQYLACHQLLERLYASNSLLRSIEDLPAYIRPLLCSSPQDQARFDEHFQTWYSSLSLDEIRELEIPKGIQDEVLEEPQQSGTQTQYQWRGWLAGFFLITLLVLFAFFLISKPNLTELEKGTFHGFIEFASGTDGETGPLAGANIQLSDSITLSDSFGRFYIDFEQTDLTATLTITHEEFQPVVDTVLLDKDSLSITYVLDRKTWADFTYQLQDQLSNLRTDLAELSAGFETNENEIEAVRQRITSIADKIEALDQTRTYEAAVLTDLEQEISTVRAEVARLEQATPLNRLRNLVNEINALPRISSPPPPSFYQKYHQHIQWIAAILPLLLTLLFLLIREMLNPMVLKRRSTRGDPTVKAVEFERSTGPLYESDTFRHTMSRLRTRESSAVQRFDLASSITATTHAGGFPTDVYLTDTFEPEYLILIDRASFEDHQTKLVERVIQQLEDYGIYTSQFYFDRDPRYCFEDNSQAATVPLEVLAIKYPNHRLLIFSDGEGFISSISGYPEAWLQMLEAWPSRALFTPVQEDWDNREYALAGSNMLVLPFSEYGLRTYVNSFESEEGIIQPGGIGFKRMPNLLSDTRRWLSHLPPSNEEVKELIEVLRIYLGDKGFYWLCSCAVYPELHWDLTLYLGNHLSAPKESGEKLFEAYRLLRLARLPWFREGRMPAWLRLELLNRMELIDSEFIEDVKNCISTLLSSNKTTKEGFKLDIALYEHRKFLDTEPTNSPLTDRVFLQAMTGRRIPKLAVKAPEKLLQFLFKEGNPQRGLRSSLLIVMAVLLGGLLFFNVPEPPQNQQQASLLPRFSVSTDSLAINSVLGLTLPYALSDQSAGYYDSLYVSNNVQNENTLRTENDFISWLMDSLTKAIPLSEPIAIATDTAPSNIDQSPIYLSFAPALPEVVAPPLINALTFTPGSPAIGDTITFTVDVVGSSPITQHQWDFGDNTTPVNTNISPTTSRPFSLPGPYELTLTVTNESGVSSNASFNFVVDSAQTGISISSELNNGQDNTTPCDTPCIEPTSGEFITLDGQVSVFNSLYSTGSVEYVSDAYVSAPFSNPDDTDDQGRFTLQITGIDVGEEITISVEKAGLEVVNSYDLERVVVGRKTPLQVYMANEGELAQAQVELYNISRDALFANRDSLIARLLSDSVNTIIELEAQYGTPIENTAQAIELINNRTETLEKSLPETAQRLATTNLDFAPEIYKIAYEYFIDGQLEEAITTLYDAELGSSTSSSTLGGGKKAI